MIDIDSDFSWIEDNDRLTQIEDNYTKESQKTIWMHFIYVNVDSYISNIVSDKYVIDVSMESCISNTELMRIIHSNAISTTTSKYKLSDILLYNVIVEPENIQSYINLPNVETPLKSISTISDNITIPPSIFIFHNINCIYFIYDESVTQTPRRDNDTKQHRKTKCVKFNLQANKRNTRRAF